MSLEDLTVYGENFLGIFISRICELGLLSQIRSVPHSQTFYKFLRTRLIRKYTKNNAPRNFQSTCIRYSLMIVWLSSNQSLGQDLFGCIIHKQTVEPCSL